MNTKVSASELQNFKRLWTVIMNIPDAILIGMDSGNWMFCLRKNGEILSGSNGAKRLKKTHIKSPEVKTVVQSVQGLTDSIRKSRS